MSKHIRKNIPQPIKTPRTREQTLLKLHQLRKKTFAEDKGLSRLPANEEDTILKPIALYYAHRAINKGSICNPAISDYRVEKAALMLHHKSVYTSCSIVVEATLCFIAEGVLDPVPIYVDGEPLIYDYKGVVSDWAGLPRNPYTQRYMEICLRKKARITDIPSADSICTRAAFPAQMSYIANVKDTTKRTLHYGMQFPPSTDYGIEYTAMQLYYRNVCTSCSIVVEAALCFIAEGILPPVNVFIEGRPLLLDSNNLVQDWTGFPINPYTRRYITALQLPV
jgi:hypothetical protein